ncbi:MAG: TRAP transporter large permease [Clostridium sp.]|nr:TRAP transporter large permease [Clostridium sp.]
MGGLIIVTVFLGCVFTTVPIGFAIGLCVVAYSLFTGSVNMNYIASGLFASCDSFPLMAIPFFILSGALMEGGGLSRRLVQFFDSLVGHLTGGLAIVTVITCMFFGAISGSGPATTAAVGAIMVPTMVEKGYDKKFAMALVAAAGCLGVIIPPSIPMVTYGISVNASIATMFMGGFLPGVVLGTLLIVTAVHICKVSGFTGNGEKFSFKKVRAAFKDAFWAILSPVIILGGIYSGQFTPTEAAVVSVVYALLVGLFAYKELELKSTYKKFAEAASTHGTVNIIVGTSTILGRVLTLEQIPDQVATAMLGFTDNRIVMLIIINLLLLACGCLLETNSSILILAPILFPVAASLGVDMIHFGIIMVVNLAIGFITPPVGVNLFVACGIGKIPFAELVKRIIPFLVALLIGLILITYIPAITLTLPRVFGYAG